MGGGVISAVMHCASGGKKQTMKMNGTYGPDSYHIKVSTSASGSTAAEEMTMTAVMDAQRIGACTGKEKS